MNFVNIPKAAVSFIDCLYQDFVLISITSGTEDPPKVPECCIDILYLKFEDVDRKKDDCVYFNREHAKKIIDFFNKYKSKKNNFVIHCTAGISRSAGVAAALYRIYYDEDNQRYWEHFMPNMLVYRTILRVHFGLADSEFI